jgi:arsenate reductase
MKFYHNPQCKKSCQALALLKNTDVQVIHYIIDGIDADEVVVLSKALGMHPSEFVRKNEPAYQALGTDEFSVEEWANIIEQNPVLLERPIFLNGNQAVIGRPPEKVLDLIN